jgi:murein L,D-transpeptidase YcbB/YkuD
MNRTLTMIFGAIALLATGPLAAQPRGDEPIPVPASIKQGIDFVYVDPAMTSVSRRARPRNWLSRVFSGEERRQGTPGPFFGQLASGLEEYRATWGALPSTKIPAGPVLKPGATGRRVAALRTRLGLPAGTAYDGRVAQAVTSYQIAHGLAPADGVVGRATLASLNRGPLSYERQIAVNMERAWRLPKTRAFDRYVIVDSGSALAYLVERDRIVDSMKVIVGSPKTKTPMMAVIMRNAKANPYWNVPPELFQTLTAKRVLEQGVGYLNQFHYEVLSDWGPTATRLDPKTINWKAAAAGKLSHHRARQLPGPWNSMGAMKFEMPNDYGIYLHDTPIKENFDKADRWISNGCVRLEDYRRFASWVFGRPPAENGAYEQNIALPRPVPVFMTYLTVVPGREGGLVFRADPYGHDAEAVKQMFGNSTQIAMN